MNYIFEPISYGIVFLVSEPAAIDVFHFEGEGLQYRGKLIGIKDVEGPRGDEMCQAAMQEIVAALKQSKEHKARITISVSLHGLKLKDEKGTVSRKMRKNIVQSEHIAELVGVLPAVLSLCSCWCIAWCLMRSGSSDRHERVCTCE